MTGLTLPGQAAPHIELLCYRGAFDRATPTLNDIAATRLILAFDGRAEFHAARAAHRKDLVDGADGEETALLRDPDAHLLQFATNG